MTVSSIAKRVLPLQIANLLRKIRTRWRLLGLGIRLIHRVAGTEYFGTRYGGYAVPTGLVKDGEGLCLGAGEDISFEIELAARLAMTVHIFDPTPRSIAYSTSVIGELETEGALTGRLLFHPYGVWSEAKVMRFYAPQDATHVSHSILNMEHTTEFFEAECWTPHQVVNRLDLDDLALLKLNIEGAEYEVMQSVFDAQIRPTVICITFDELHTQIDDGATRRLKGLIARFLAESYVPVHAVDCKVTFVREDALVS